ncbi:MAG: PIN domain-containing protein [Planctomycetia bacterium]|nr:PIN domain-containing protein [Planctomycetia bacterium]
MSRPNGYLLDTNILIALARNSDLGKYIDRTYQLTSGQYAFYLPVVVLGEAQAFAAKRSWGSAKQTALTNLLSYRIALNRYHTRLG